MKKILFSLLLLLTVIGLVGCGKEEVDTRKVVTISDDGFGVTTLKYDEDKDYTVKEDKSGKYMEVVIKSEVDNFEMQLYHIDINSSYDSTKQNRSSSDGYQEFTWNGYSGYIYNADKYGLMFNIKFDDKHGLFGDIDAYNYKSANMLEDFKGESIQKILNSVKFEEK